MVRHTLYMQNMIKQIESGKSEVTSPDCKVKIVRNIERVCGKICVTIKCYHYETLILTIAFNDSLAHIGKNGRSFTISADAYSCTDARIINQLLEKYVPGFVAHSCKCEVIVD